MVPKTVQGALATHIFPVVTHGERPPLETQTPLVGVPAPAVGYGQKLPKKANPTCPLILNLGWCAFLAYELVSE